MKPISRLVGMGIVHLSILFLGLLLWTRKGELTWRLFLFIAVQSVCLLLFYKEAVKAVLHWKSQIKRLLMEEDKDGLRLKQLCLKDPEMQDLERVIYKYVHYSIDRSAADALDKQTELMTLQSQINPHFLYNTLDTIRGQAVLDDNEEIAGMVETLAAFFRYSISGTGDLVTLRDEISNIKRYMMIQNYRFNDRYELVILIGEEEEPALDYRVPRLIIQPLVENAILHGLKDKLSGGRIVIEAALTDRTLLLTVSDNGSGIPAQELEQLNDHIHRKDIQIKRDDRVHSRRKGIALPNINRRIELLFGSGYGLNIYSTAGMGTDAELTLPVIDSREGILEQECEKKN